MSAGSYSAALGEADLHGLVDDCVPASRRAETMRRLAASSSDRARFEAWRDQNDLIRNAFREVDREPLPVSLNLRSPPRLHCIPPVDAPLVAEPVRTSRWSSPSRLATGFVTALVVVIGLGASWLVLQTGVDPQVSGVGLRGSVDSLLANQAEQAVSAPPSGDITSANGKPATRAIPDLSGSGFAFTKAERLATDPSGLVFHYQTPSAERVAITVARAPRSVLDGPVKIGNAFSWRKGETLYAIAGTVPSDRLRDIAEAVKTSLAD